MNMLNAQGVLRPEEAILKTSSSQKPALLPQITHYYLRQLLHQNLHPLSPNAGFGHAQEFNPLDDLNLLLLAQYPEAQVLRSHLHSLEHLALRHQTLSSQGAKHTFSLQETERQIFQILGIKPQPTQPHGTILIVDDVPDNLLLLSLTLVQQGYEVCSAISGSLALNRAAEIQPDMILLDVMLPGIDGYEVCERLKSAPATQNIPVIFLSAVDDPFDKVKAFEIGGADYITKPFQIEEVLTRIEHHIRRHQQQRQLELQNQTLQAMLEFQRQSEKRYRSTFEDAVCGMLRSTPDGRFLEVNQALAEIYGYDSPQDLMTQVTNIAHQLYVHPQRRRDFIYYLRQYQKVKDFESQVFRKDGQIIWISEDARAVQDEQGNLLFYEGTVRDISDRRQTEERLRQFHNNLM